MDGRAPLPAGGDGDAAEYYSPGDAPGALHRTAEDRHRLQHRPHVAPAASRRGLRGGRFPVERPGDLWRRPGLPYAGGRDVRLPSDGPGRQSRAVRRRRRGHFQGVQQRAFLPQGQEFHDPARRPVSRLRLEGNHAGAAPAAPAGGMLAADSGRLDARAGIHGQARHSGHGRRRFGRGRHCPEAGQRLDRSTQKDREHRYHPWRTAGDRLPVPHREKQGRRHSRGA